MSIQLKIKHQGVEIEFTAEDLQQIASELLSRKPAAPSVPKAAPKRVAKPVKAGAKRRGRPPGVKNKPKVNGAEAPTVLN